MAIIISKNGKNAKKIDKSSFEKEDSLQKYIYDNPESIPLYEIKEDIRLLIVAREFPTDSGPIDELGLDRDGEIYPTETKLYKNPDKRYVVGQILDYGASMWRSYGANFEEFVRILDERTRKQFGVGLHERMKEFFDLDDEGVTVLLENVRRNLREGNFRFIVLMDKLHSKLKDLIVFLNQNSRFDIFAVELEYYKHEDYEIVIPKLFGAEVKKEVGVSASGARKHWDETAFLEQARQSVVDGKTYETLAELYQFAREKADRVDFGTGQESGSFTFKLEHPKSKSGFIAIFTVWTRGTIRFRFGNIRNRAGEDTAELFFEKLSGLPFAKKWNKKETIQSYGPSATLEEAFPDRKSLERFEAVILEFAKEIKE